MEWLDLPEELRLKDTEIAYMPASRTKELFEKAEQLGVLDDFTNLYWEATQRIYGDTGYPNMQKCVEFLEERKRTIGRYYNMCKLKYGNAWLTRFQTIRYNEAESHIQWLVSQYGCKRTSKRHYLEV